MNKRVIGVFVGSLRRDSFSRKVARSLSDILVAMADAFEVKPIELSGLCLFDQDFDDDGRTPVAWSEFRREVKSLDGVVFVTPEYNRSMPALLKNALDIGSRPPGQNVWNDKPGAIIGVSPGRLGALASVQALKQPASFVGIHLMPQPEAYVSNAASLFDATGRLTDEATRRLLQNFAAAFTAWVERFKTRDEAFDRS
ncbi:MAG: NAD(P)H-dependent oxidoreductase [Myxococcales bacterium]|jgi:chromate reductase|nr:NAD(P)H-dependent oxidoreductase [Myxococcales bacterium]